MKDLHGLSAFLSVCERKREFVAVSMKRVLSTEMHHRLLLLILFSLSAALNFLLVKTDRVALAQCIKYLSLYEYCSISMCDGGCY